MLGASLAKQHPNESACLVCVVSVGLCALDEAALSVVELDCALGAGEDRAREIAPKTSRGKKLEWAVFRQMVWGCAVHAKREKDGACGLMCVVER